MPGNWKLNAKIINQPNRRLISSLFIVSPYAAQPEWIAYYITFRLGSIKSICASHFERLANHSRDSFWASAICSRVILSDSMPLFSLASS